MYSPIEKVQRYRMEQFQNQNFLEPGTKINFPWVAYNSNPES